MKGTFKSKTDVSMKTTEGFLTAMKQRDWNFIRLCRIHHGAGAVGCDCADGRCRRRIQAQMVRRQCSGRAIVDVPVGGNGSERLQLILLPHCK